MNKTHIFEFLKKNARKYGISVALILIVVSSAIRVLSAEPERQDEPILPTVSLASLDSFEAKDRIVATGTIESQDQVTIMSEVSAPVASVFARPGESVAPGTPLVQFESADFDAQLAQALAGVQAAQAQISIQTNPSDTTVAQAELAVAQARAGLQSATTSRDQLLEANRNSLEDAEQALAQLYRTSYYVVLSSESSLKDALTLIADYQDDGLNCTSDQICLEIARVKRDIIRDVYNVQNAGNFSSRSIQGLESDYVTGLDQSNPDGALLRESLSVLRDNLVLVREALVLTREGLEIITAVGATSTDFAAVDAERALVDAAIATTNTKLESFNSVEGGVRFDGEAEVIYDLRNSIAQSERVSNASVESAQLALRSAELSLETVVNGPRALDLAPLYAQLAQAQAAYDAASASQRRYYINAPFAGEIVSVDAKAGEYYTPGRSIITIANPDVLEITVFVSPDDRRTLSRHAEVLVNGVASGVITSIGSGIDPSTGKVEVRVAVIDNSEQLLIGEVVTVAFEKEVEGDEIQVPLSAVRTTPEGSYVFTVSEENILIPHRVITGSIEGDRIWIAFDGSTPSEIVENARGLRAGDQVNR